VVLASVPDAVVSLFVDAFVLIVACPFVLGFGAVLLRGLWPVAAIVAAFAYLTLAWASGQSLGMRVARIRLVREDAGGPPGVARAAMRAALLLPVVVAVFLLADAALPQDSQSFAARPAVLYACVGLVLFGFVTHLWALWDSRSRGLHDAATRLLAVEDTAAARVHFPDGP